MIRTANNKKTAACYTLIFLHILLGVGAFFGGGLLILAPDGSLLGMPLSLLQYSSFHSYLIPGIILFLALGCYPLLVALFLISEKTFHPAELFNLYKDTHWAWLHSFYIGFILIIWLTIETYLLRGIYFIHVVYMFLGLAIQAMTLLPGVKNHYTHKDQ